MHHRSPIMAGLALGLAVSLGLLPEGALLASDGGSPSPGLSPAPVSGILEATIPVAGSPDWPLAAFGSVWVLAPDLPLHGAGTPNLVRIDPATNTVVATIPLPDRLCQGMTATEDRIWMCSVDGLVAVDPATNAISTTVPVKLAGLFYRLAVGAGRVWALGSTSFLGDTVIGLDPATGTTVSHPAGGSIGGLTHAFDALWLTLPNAGSIVRMDADTGETKELVTGLPAPTQIIADGDSLWVTLYGGEDYAPTGDPQLVRLDPATGAIEAELTIGASGRGGVDLAAGSEGIWVRNTQPWLAMVDRATNAVTARYESGPDINRIQGPLVEAFDSLWTVNIEEDAVYRLRP